MQWKLDGSIMEAEYKKAFGKDISEATSEEVRFFMYLSKHARLRCRSNAALYSWLNRNFTSTTIKEVPVEGKDWKRAEITSKTSKSVVQALSDEES